jgi:hypothetical protein
MPKRLYYTLILIGGNEVRVRFDDMREANSFFEPIIYPEKRTMEFVLVTDGLGKQWYIKPTAVVAWSDS